MCITYPVKIIKVGEGGAIVNKNNKELQVKTSLLPGVSVGDWILIHANLAIKKITAEEAEEIKNYYKDL